MSRRKNGTILSRNYGIRLRMPGRVEDVIVTPSAYILAQLGLETPNEIRARLTEYAFVRGLSAREVQEEFAQGVENREGSKALLNRSRRTASNRRNLILEGMVHRGGEFHGNVWSKRGDHPYQLSLREPPRNRDVAIGFPGSRVETLDNLYAGSKSRGTIVGVHLAIPEIALIMDQLTQAPQDSNMTGLYPSQRAMDAPTPSLPFAFNMFRPISRLTARQKRLRDMTTQLWVDYYVNGALQFDLSVAALNNLEAYTSVLLNAVTSEADQAYFTVIRQKEEEQSITSRAQDRRTAAVSVLLPRLREYLVTKRGCFPVGYCREFVGTPWETVAERFVTRGRGPVYSIVVSPEHPPLIVGKRLGAKASNWTQVEDPLRTNHIRDKIGRSYSAVDDATRRHATVQLILPDKSLEGNRITLPANLRDEYASLRRN